MSAKENIQELTLEEVMGERFGRYSKYIIQERAIPDIRDGLKPVQRRILYSMNKDGNTNDKAYRKSAKSVGNIMGNYHPHGDSSIYEAMVRMSQDWKLREILIDMHGNNGSMDGDSPAAMRYTEARLAKLTSELLQDIEKETVDFVWNFDDTEKEPTVLPAKFPNLLVNGSTGISAGYATEIPTHNLGEIIDGTIHLIDNPNATLEKMMTFIPGPDFPTGAIIQGKEGIKQAYETGRGKIVLRAKTEIEAIRGGREAIVVHEVPYEVNKSTLVKKIDEIKILKKIDGISEVRDETDRTGLRIVIELKKDANTQGILNYLFKQTDLQVNYNFNMVAIDHMTPKQVGLIHILKSYIEHRQKVIQRRSLFELTKAKKREHIVEGLMKALSILDKVIKTIRGSKDKKDAKNNLINSYQFTEEQAEAIVILQLYRLTNTDITDLKNEATELAKRIGELEEILNNEKTLLSLMKKELREVKKAFASPRLSLIQDEIQEIQIETHVLIAQEEVAVTVTRGGYVKRSGMRSYAASKPEELGMREDDSLLLATTANTLDHLLLFTNKGNLIYRPIHELPDIRWKDIGEHISQTILNLSMNESIIKAFTYSQIEEKNFVVMTKEGFIKQTAMSEFAPWRTYKSRPTNFIKLKTTTDEVLNVELVDSDTQLDVFLVSNRAFGLRYPLAEVPVVGKNTAGVKSMNLKTDDFVVNGITVYDGADEPVTILTQRGAIKRMLAQELPQIGRAKRGLMVLRELKNKPHRIVYMNRLMDPPLNIVTNKGNNIAIDETAYPIGERTSNGSFAIDETSENGVYTVFPIKQANLTQDTP
ncbi:MAG: DNA topoisomerase IV subunit A [Streptococcaceae bacterium]|jgi:topoisomerase-4 subunit A|nr:DNA topoisomerase IV subunit A [Streptococcaceae bacterium]